MGFYQFTNMTAINHFTTSLKSNSFGLESSKGNIPYHTVVHKFGQYNSVGTSFVPITRGGNYQTPQSTSAGSHSADITIENGSGGTDWAIIDSTDFPKAQSEIGAYTIPVGYTGYLLSEFGFSDSTKVTELIFFKREGIAETAAPYQAMRTVFEERIEGGEFTVNPSYPIKLGTGCDVGFLGKVNTGTAEIEVDFELLIVKNEYI